MTILELASILDLFELIQKILGKKEITDDKHESLS